MRKAAVWTALVVAVLFAAGTVLAAPPEKVVLKGAADAKKPAVTFTHKAHTEKVKACAECHHKDAAGAEQKCSKCHGDKTEGKKLSAKEAFHAQCKDCHVKEKKGPTKCDDCHKK